MVKKVENDDQLSRLVLHGYKSIASLDIELGLINVLIGANGAGKSNFISFFRLVGKMLEQQLQITVSTAGGPDALLHFGRKNTEELEAKLIFGRNGYEFALRPTQDNRMTFSREGLHFKNRPSELLSANTFWASAGHLESLANAHDVLPNAFNTVLTGARKWRVYHFHDTSSSARVKQIHGINDNEYLRDDARNLAAFLYRLKKQHETHYKRIVKSIQLVAPFFGDFHLRPTVDNPEKIQLEWTERGQDEPFTASALSDGTLRFICLATVLQQPEEFVPAAILIDEPELGLHPFAVSVLGAMMKSAAQRHQLIVSTQSVELVNEFDAEDLIVVDKHGGASVFHRPDESALAEWLAEYSLGELWKKNLLGGRPGR